MTKGFTTIELFMVVGIMLIISVAAAPLYSNLQVSAQLNESNSQIAQTLRLAREQSVSRFNNSAHGVKFFADSYVIYQGASYASRTVDYDRIVELDPPLSINSDLTDAEVNFSMANGLPNTTGTTTLTHSVGGTRSVYLNSFGMVTEN